MPKSTIQSTIKGKAYEYACVLSLQELLSGIRCIEIIENQSLEIARNRYNHDTSEAEQSEMLLSAKSGIQAIIEMEPKIIEDGSDSLLISLQPDNVASNSGDVRDVLIIRRNIQWEIGISVKHNNASLKHSRLSAHIDFGEAWVDSPCSQNYFDTIKPIFDYLQTLKEIGAKWHEMTDKETSVYIPILNAFRAELKQIISKERDIPAKLIKYLVGSNGKDYYKLIHRSNHTTSIIPFNIYGSLNQKTSTTAPKIIIPPISLPNRIIDLSFKENSQTTLILTMNNGWSISFRIHNASEVVEPSLKFDILLEGQPADLFYLDRQW
jgi:hypothetical protein